MIPGFDEITIEGERDTVSIVGRDAFSPERLRDDAKDDATVPEIVSGPDEPDLEIAYFQP